MITLVNQFEVRGPADQFEAVFGEVSDFMSAQPGFRSNRLLRSGTDEHRYVNIAEWDDEQSLRAALAHEGWKAVAAKLAPLGTGAPHVYSPVLERHADQE